MRLRLSLRGVVQGVGFRPFVHRLATSLALRGWVGNSPAGVTIEAEGAADRLREFAGRVAGEKPPGSYLESFESTWLDATGYAAFEIRPSATQGEKTVVITPDLATCPACLAEIFDPQNRRYGYPFTNCTHCGPRYSIIEALPYDRPNTTMRRFQMCARCQAEYDDPGDRRFHAQPNACPDCGPHLELWDAAGTPLHEGNEASLTEAVDRLRAGAILAVKGLGGFHLLVDARNEAAIRRLRERKRREEKPLAVMLPSLAAARTVCQVSADEERLLRSAACPIVLLRQRGYAPKFRLAEGVAPGNPWLGVMLPYTPLHHLLLRRFGGPLVATSGNLSDEPLCVEEHEAACRLERIADVFLVHNRPIARQVDDSIARIVWDRELILRRARGYAPLPVPMRAAEPGVEDGVGAVLAVGAHLKNAVALAKGGQVFISQHIGDLETSEAQAAFMRVAADLPRLYDAPVEIYAADWHPDYSSARTARQRAETEGARLVLVQHHLAHVLSCMAENDLRGPVLGVAWDGTGFGGDGTVWGGEFIAVEGREWGRVAHWRQFRLPGGERAVREPRRSALGLLWEQFAHDADRLKAACGHTGWGARELAALVRMCERRVNSPLTSSVGRLFDAVASIAGIRQTARHEGQAAMELEFAIHPDTGSREPYPVGLRGGSGEPWVLDWEPLVAEILAGVGQGGNLGVISARFHETLAAAVVLIARQAGFERVALSGGCFQNETLLRRTVARLREAGFQPYWHQRIPPNDGGIALGQIAAVRWGIREQPRIKTPAAYAPSGNIPRTPYSAPPL